MAVGVTTSIGRSLVRPEQCGEHVSRRHLGDGYDRFGRLEGATRTSAVAEQRGRSERRLTVQGSDELCPVAGLARSSGVGGIGCPASSAATGYLWRRPPAAGAAASGGQSAIREVTGYLRRPAISDKRSATTAITGPAL